MEAKGAKNFMRLFHANYSRNARSDAKRTGKKKTRQPSAENGLRNSWEQTGGVEGCERKARKGICEEKKKRLRLSKKHEGSNT